MDNEEIKRRERGGGERWREEIKGEKLSLTLKTIPSKYINVYKWIGTQVTAST